MGITQDTVPRRVVTSVTYHLSMPQVRKTSPFALPNQKEASLNNTCVNKSLVQKVQTLCYQTKGKDTATCTSQKVSSPTHKSELNQMKTWLGLSWHRQTSQSFLTLFHTVDGRNPFCTNGMIRFPNTNKPHGLIPMASLRGARRGFCPSTEGRLSKTSLRGFSFSLWRVPLLSCPVGFLFLALPCFAPQYLPPKTRFFQRFRN